MSGDSGLPHDEVSDGVLESILEKVGPGPVDSGKATGASTLQMTSDQLRDQAELFEMLVTGDEEEERDLAAVRRAIRELVARAAELEQVKKERDEALGAAECSSECEGAYFARMQAAEAELEQVKKERDEARDFLRTQTMMREAERDRLEVVKQKLLVDWRRAAGERDRLAEALRLISTRTGEASHNPGEVAKAALASMEGDKPRPGIGKLLDHLEGDKEVPYRTDEPVTPKSDFGI